MLTVLPTRATRSGLPDLRVWGVAALLLLVLAVGVTPASAWEVQKSSNGLVLQVSPDDTQTVTFTLYCDAKSTCTAYTATFSGYYNTSRTPYTIDVAGAVKSFELPRGNDGVTDGWNLLVIKRGSSTEEKHVVYIEPQEVELVGSPAVQIDTDTLPLPVSLPADATLTVSADTTLPVTVGAVAGLPTEVLTFLPMLLVVLGGLWVGGFIFGKR